MAVVEISGAVSGLGTPAGTLSGKIALVGNAAGVARLGSFPVHRVFQDVEGYLGEFFYVDDNGWLVPIDASSLRDGYIPVWDETNRKWRVASPAASVLANFNFDVPLAIGHPQAAAVAVTGAHVQGVEIPVAGTIIGWTLTSDVSCTAVVDVKKATYSGWPTTASIWGTKPSLTAARKNQVTGLNISVAAGDMWDVNLDSNNNAKQLVLSVKIRRS